LRCIQSVCGVLGIHGLILSRQKGMHHAHRTPLAQPRGLVLFTPSLLRRCAGACHTAALRGHAVRESGALDTLFTFPLLAWRIQSRATPLHTMDCSLR